MSYCVKCGKELKDDDAFCPSCGRKVGAPEEKAPEVKVMKVEDDRERYRRKAGTGILLSAVLPGMGLIYAGKNALGFLVMFVAAVLTFIVTPAAWLFEAGYEVPLAAAIVLYLGDIVCAYLACERFNKDLDEKE